MTRRHRFQLNERRIAAGTRVVLAGIIGEPQLTVNVIQFIPLMQTALMQIFVSFGGQEANHVSGGRFLWVGT